MAEYRDDVARALAMAPVRMFKGSAWRVHWREIAPTDWSLSLRTSGRYHRGLDLFPAGEAFAALYTSLEPEIAIWEMVRRSAARNLAFLRNNLLTELHVRLARIVDLSEPSTVGLTEAGLTGPDLSLCQALAAAAVTEGFEGLMVPSAALDGINLVILPSNLDEPAPIRAVRSRRLPIDLHAPDEPR